VPTEHNIIVELMER